MLLWISLLVGLALLLAGIALTVAMFRAERRARRNLYRSLGLAEETVELLMSRSGDVLSGLALVRLSPAGGAEVDAAEFEEAPATPDPAPFPAQPTIRLVHPVTGEARTPGGPRREPYSGRRRF
jgi:hypothetical protein